MLATVSIFLGFFFSVNFLFAIFIVFYERKDVSSTWAWLIVALLLPYFGFLLYMLLGFSGRKTRHFVNKSKKDKEIYEEFAGNDKIAIDDISLKNRKTNVLSMPNSERFNDMVYLNSNSGRGELTLNNDIVVFHNGMDKFGSLIEDIRNAESHIHLQYYIFRNDALGRQIIDELATKAAEGIEVKVFIDGLGNYGHSKKMFKPIVEAGGNFQIFFRPFMAKVNFRNHRKLVVIDGIIGYIGGFNIGVEYIGKSKRFGNWRDTHVRILGEAVKTIQLRFMMDWNFCSENKITLDEKYFPALPPVGSVKMQIVSSGPDTEWDSIKYAYKKMITEAEKSVYISSPYFIPDESIFESLRVAALAGIDVRILIPAKPDHPFVYWTALSYIGELLKAGVKCYEYEGGFIHSKVIVIDDMISSVGTANMDIRSFKLNFEVNAFIYSEATAEELSYQFFEDLESSQELTLEAYELRSKFTKVKEAVSRLLSPIL
ncbi:MAG: cardiolipin synthase [Defluviitaleaceae bacterium]|nr:cardiolipin synthase [Defluviitaleaceae bacterium]